MTLAIVIGAILLWFFLVGVFKELHAEAKDRREDRIMAAYVRAEGARYHRYLLADIEAQRRATTEELIHAATRARGDVIDGTAVEIEPISRPLS